MWYDPLVTDLVEVGNEQLRYVLDNASDFLESVGQDYVPNRKKPNFEDWNPPDGGAFGSVDKIPGGLAQGKSPKEFDQVELARGIKIEKEHTSDPEIAQEIAMDHLVEDPLYYQKLEKMESKGSSDPSLDLIDMILDNLNPRLREIDSLIERVASLSIPRALVPLKGMTSKARKIWVHLMSSRQFRRHLRDRTPGDQWTLSRYVFILHALQAGLKPFTWWSRVDEAEFTRQHEKIDLNLKKKREFESSQGLSVESYQEKLGRCPPDFVWVESSQKCVWKESV
jgi:hypothetical protein